MPDVWYLNATRKPVPGLSGGGSMVGGKPRAVHHTTEGGSVSGAEATYAKTKAAPHFTIDYVADVVHQHLPVDVAATALKNLDGGVQTNRQGDVCIQIEWVGYAKDPFTAKRGIAGPKVRAFLDWIRAWGIPDAWPMGGPLGYPQSYGGDNGDRNARVWVDTAGHYGHSQTPENLHGDPGAISPSFVKQTAKPKPAPRTLYLRDPRMTGPDVEGVAKAMQRKGYDPGAPLNVFGPAMDRITRAVERNTLRRAATGKCDAAVRKALGMSA